MPSGLRALVLAGDRRERDALAEQGGVAHKALLEVAGVPMLVRVVRTLAALPRIGFIQVSTGSAALLDAHAELAARRADGLLRHHASAGSPAASVEDAVASLPAGSPLLVTTADHPLLSPAMVEHFCDAAERSGAAVAAAVVPESVIRARFPDVRRTFIPLRGEAITGANLFWFASAEAAAAARFWRRTEEVRKQPWRLAALFGPGVWLRFAARRLALDDVTQELSRRIGLPVAAVRLPFAECGLDVDRPADLRLAERLLDAAPGAASPSGA
ncbi:MAG: NTP transferase domain-containing protein [Myxococcales bacterium]|nr:NTP transferase domain-containing protein [Myxococcales bacterium]